MARSAQRRTAWPDLQHVVVALQPDRAIEAGGKIEPAPLARCARIDQAYAPPIVVRICGRRRFNPSLSSMLQSKQCVLRNSDDSH
jgi:hypothetical protein